MVDKLQFAMLSKPRQVQRFDEFGVSAGDIISVLSQFEPFGVWRMELDTGLVFWTSDIYEIHELPVAEGPVNVKMAIDAYHPDDRELLVDCLEDAVARKTGFHFVLRLATRSGGYKLVKSIGKYHVDESGAEALIGTFCEDPGGVRGVVVKE